MSYYLNDRIGLLFAMSNAVTNSVSAFARSEFGELIFLDAYETGGQGTAEGAVAPLGSQGALVRSRNGRNLFVVNAGDGTVSSFRIGGNQLRLMCVTATGGARPVSLAGMADLLYVANAGGEEGASLSAMRVLPDGKLEPAGEPHLLWAGAGPVSVRFSPCGRFLAASLAGENRVLVFSVGPGGRLTGPLADARVGATPVGVVFPGNDLLLVGERGEGALSAHFLGRDGALSQVSGSIPSGHQGTGWLSLHPGGRYAYASSVESGMVSHFQILPEGRLSLVESARSSGGVDAGPIDSVVDRNARFLYVLNGAQGTIAVFHIGRYGNMEPVQLVEKTGLPTLGAQGIAAV